ncbi:MAG: helix-turn-helix domain-containing protein [Rhodobacteraceae bacterium]|nr:helix-turn-helix domain-containing protein [Paracoccaceae bacterium]
MAKMLIGSRIRERREAAGLRQSEVARRAGISASYLNLIEHNRRGIAGKVLLNIASVLDFEVSSLGDAAADELLRNLKIAAAGADPAVETERTEELIGRFPGWAGLIAGLGEKVRHLEHSVSALSDRLAHDPLLAESLHAMLSSVTAIHATSGILAQSEKMEQLQQRRFQNNIHQESARLSDLSRQLVGYFDRLSADQGKLSTPMDEVDAVLTAAGFYFPELERGDEAAVTRQMAAFDAAISNPARLILIAVLEQAAADIAALPLAEFVDAARVDGDSTAALAARFNCLQPTIYRRLAFLPPDTGLPGFGLIACDATGAVLLRKPLPGFTLPRYGAGCGLWPLYQAMSQPHVPMVALLQTTEARMFRAEAIASYLDPAAARTQPVLRSVMLFRSAAGGAASPGLQPVEVGPSCRICPRQACPARREPSIMADA